MTKENSPFSPGYSIRYSKKARRIGLRVVPARGLEVVLPKGTDPSCVPALVARHKVWIERAMGRMGIDPEGGPRGLPEWFYIKGGSEKIVLQDPTGQNTVFAETPHRAVLSGEAPDYPDTPDGAVLTRPLVLPSAVTREGAREGLGLAWLKSWVRDEAGKYLRPKLEDLANRHDFEYASLSIRMQRTRWGSCSVRGKLNLNACLLFLPEDLSGYILLHELCHTKEMNHKEGFWRLIFSIEPDALELDKRMRKAWRYVPSWVME